MYCSSRNIPDCSVLRWLLQDHAAEKFETHPIIFGDFLKIGAPAIDRVYDDLQDLKKLGVVLSDVSTSQYSFVL